MNKDAHTCWLCGPANCQHRIDGKLSFVFLCGGNSLSDEVAGCPYRFRATILDDYVAKDDKI